MSVTFFRTGPENGLSFDNFSKIAHKIVKSKYFVNIENESDSAINSLSSDTQFVESSFVLYKLSGGGGGGHSLSLLFCKSVQISITSVKIRESCLNLNSRTEEAQLLK